MVCERVYRAACSPGTPKLNFATNPSTRKRAYEANESRLAINAPLFDKILGLRREIAAILGYASWADRVLDEKMVQTSKAALDFLADLESRLRPIGLKERAVFLAMKKDEHERLGLPYDGEFYGWDCRYYDQQFEQKMLALEENKVKEYLSVDHVVPAVLGIYQGLFGLEFKEEDVDTWHQGK